VKPALGAIGFIALAAAGATALATEVAQVARISGTPTVTRGSAPQPLHRGDSVAVGEIVETDAVSKVKILLADDSVLDVGPQSRVRLDTFALASDRRNARLDILVGKFKLAVSKFLTGPTDYEIRTPTTIAGVRGTVLWGDTDRDVICALDGTIDAAARSGDTTPKRLAAGECVNQMKAGKTTPLKPTAAEVAAYLKEVTIE